MNKSVLHIAIDSPQYNSNAIMNAWIALGFEYYSISWQQIRFSYGIEYLRKEIIRQTIGIKPTVLFVHVQSPEILDIDTWEELAALSFVINFTFDVRDHERMKWAYEIAPIVGFTFFASSEDVAWCGAMGISNVAAIHSSCDMLVYQPKPNSHFVFDVVFCGNNNVGSNLNFPLSDERQKMIAVLENKLGDRFMAYGLGQAGGIIRAEVEASVYNHSKIAISHNNFDKEDYTSDRLWKIMSSGTFCLTKHFNGIEKIFQKEIHLDWFKDFEEMQTLIDFYLSDEQERKSIAEMGCKIVRENHSWTSRVKEILAVSGISL